jgi:hypothetical protein
MFPDVMKEQYVADQFDQREQATANGKAESKEKLDVLKLAEESGRGLLYKKFRKISKKGF